MRLFALIWPHSLAKRWASAIWSGVSEHLGGPQADALPLLADDDQVAVMLDPLVQRAPRSGGEAAAEEKANKEDEPDRRLAGQEAPGRYSQHARSM